MKEEVKPVQPPPSNTDETIDDPEDHKKDLPRRFHGTVKLDATRFGRDAGKIAEEVIAHLAGLVGARVTVTLEVSAEIPVGISDQVVRIVTENSRTLKPLRPEAYSSLNLWLLRLPFFCRSIFGKDFVIGVVRCI